MIWVSAPWRPVCVNPRLMMESVQADVTPGMERVAWAGTPHKAGQTATVVAVLMLAVWLSTETQGMRRGRSTHPGHHVCRSMGR